MSKTFLSPELESLTGNIDFSLTTDFFFRALLQKNKTVLKGLISSLLHLDFDSISSVTITNEISLGELPSDKTHIMDINVILNNEAIINLEMQVLNHNNWPERSLSYLCRSFNNVQKGGDYISVTPSIHISFLDFTLFKKFPEFYSTYYLMNDKTHHIYSDKFRLSVVDLTNIKLATKEDKYYNIDKWASFFKSNTWEELKMLAQNNDIISEAVSTTYMMSKDEIAREMLRCRQESIAYEKYRENLTAELKSQLAEKDARIAELEAQLSESRK